MSSGNCPETPRQKMIGMMYLFLTAMLAVNVSSTVLNGFALVDESLRTNSVISEGNNDAIYSTLHFQNMNSPAKFGDAYNKSLEIKEKAQTLYNLIDSAKWKVARVCDGELGNPTDIKAKDNVDAGFEALVFKVVGSKKTSTAEMIKSGINDYRSFLIDDVVIDTARFNTLTSAISRSLDTSDPSFVKDANGKKDPNAEKHLSWEEERFTGIPVGAVMALMTTMQTNIRNTESMALSHLTSQVTAGDFKVNKIAAHIIPESTYLVRGAKFRADALLAATDSTSIPEYELFVNGKPIDAVNKNGQYEINCNSTGTFKVTGNIITKDENGETQTHKFNPVEYEVADPFATVSATKMNVLYAGVENPMSISVPGFSAKDIIPSLSDGSPLIPTKGGYIAQPRTPGKDVMVLVKAKMEGKTTLVGKYPFRVKSLPPPTGFIQYPKETKNASGQTITLKENFASGRLKKRDLLNSYGIVAELLDSDFEVSYKIQGFEITFYDTMGNAKTFSSSSSKFTKDQVSRIKGLSKGKSFYISNIKAIGPDGIQKRLSTIDVTIN